MSCLIKKANNDIFQRSPRSNKPPSRIIRPFELNGEGEGLALVLRYSGCNLRCPLCYAWRYAWTGRGYRYQLQRVLSALNNLTRAVNNLRKVKNKKIVWVRIQGGEPFLNIPRIFFTIEVAAEALKIIHNNKLNYYECTRAVIQTNGIIFSNLNKNEIEEIKDCLLEKASELSNGRIIFEISFKSPHQNNMLLGENVFNRQLKGFYVLLNQVFKPIWNEGLDNVAIYPIAGLGPSIDLHNAYIIPIDPYHLSQGKEVPLFHQCTWSNDFQQLFNNFTNNIVQNYNAYKDFRRNPQTNGGKKIGIEEFEAKYNNKYNWFQKSWISGYASAYRQYGITPPHLNLILRKLDSQQYNRWYNEWLHLFRGVRGGINILNSIPVSNNSSHLLNQVRQMRNRFYSSHPIQHYPYL